VDEKQKQSLIIQSLLETSLADLDIAEDSIREVTAINRNTIATLEIVRGKLEAALEVLNGRS
jgi:hypothetical protein